MNYRHGFHAGNVADVFKHLVLVRVLEALCAKDKPFCVIDTHAGRGHYLLKAGGEHEQGIGRLWPARERWPALAGYFAALAGEKLEIYPGSPRLIAGLLRPGDRAIFIERQPDEAAALRMSLRAQAGISILETDGLAALKGLVPPAENRGLVLIDPPYEQPDEPAQVVRALQAAVKRWRNGIYMVWYPIKDRRAIAPLLTGLTGLVPEGYAVEFLTLPEDVPNRLNGSGLALLNPPWALRAFLEEQLPPLAEFLAPAGGRPRVNFVDLGGVRRED
jgi:23S rRNA (adenine2030-N6)-methyltransferase